MGAWAGASGKLACELFGDNPAKQLLALSEWWPFLA